MNVTDTLSQSPSSELASTPDTANYQVEVKNMSFKYKANLEPALQDIDLKVKKNTVMGFIGPSGCGKSTLLRCFNRMNDFAIGSHVSQGSIHVLGQDIYQNNVDVTNLRKKVGMVFQKSNPFPDTIYNNVAYGLRINGITDKDTLDAKVESSLMQCGLWKEAKDRLNQSAQGLSGGQQQRLCIARTIAVSPEIILMDEPTSALDPIASARIEELITTLKQDYTLIVVTHNMQQAARISDHTAFFYLGKLIECDETQKIFTNPSQQTTENYISGKFG